MIMFPTKMQQEVLDKPDNKRICLIMNGNGTGNTTALLMAAINHECDFVWYPIPNYPTFRHYATTLTKLGFNISPTSMIARLGNKKIKFILYDNCTVDSLRGTSGAFFVDNLQWIPTDALAAILSRRNLSEYYFTHSLVDPITHNSITSFLFDFCGKDVASPEDVRGAVHLVTGYTVEDNKKFKRDNPEYISCLKSLSPRFKNMYTGEWPS